MRANIDSKNGPGDINAHIRGYRLAEGGPAAPLLHLSFTPDALSPASLAKLEGRPPFIGCNGYSLGQAVAGSALTNQNLWHGTYHAILTGKGDEVLLLSATQAKNAAFVEVPHIDAVRALGASNLQANPRPTLSVCRAARATTPSDWHACRTTSTRRL